MVATANSRQNPAYDVPFYQLIIMIDRNLVAATIFPFFAAFLGYSILSWYFTISSLSAPNVIGLSLSDGCALLSQNRLNARVMAYIDDDAYPAGTIIDQKPRPNKSIKAHQAMLLTVVAEKSLKKIPDICGMSLADATQIMTKIGLKVFSYPVNSTLPSNICIAQSPSSDSLVELGAVLLLYYSHAESSHYLLPSFIDQFADDAIESIEKYGHHVECINEKTFANIDKKSVQKGVVVAQKPLSGTLMNEIEKEIIYLTIKL